MINPKQSYPPLFNPSLALPLQGKGMNFDAEEKERVGLIGASLVKLTYAVYEFSSALS